MESRESVNKTQSDDTCRAGRACAADLREELDKDAAPSNTASNNSNCDQIGFVPLRWGVDSLYLSYPGMLADSVTRKLETLKKIAQSEHESEQAKAQYVVDEHARCLNKEQAGEYLGIGVTLLTELGVPFIRLGRRCLYDKLDLDSWLDDYKSRERGRAGKEKTLWPMKLDSTEDRIPGIGGLQQPSRTASDYAKVLGLKIEKKPGRC